MAHRAVEIDTYQLSWFALHWAIVSYPALKQRASRLTAANLPVATVKNRRDIVITESILAEQALFIHDL